MELTLVIFFFLYLFFLVIFATFALIQFYHIFLGASSTYVSWFVTTILTAVTLATLFGTAYLLRDTNWRQPLMVQQSGTLHTSPLFIP